MLFRGLEPTCESAEAEDQGLARAIVAPSSVHDKVRYTATDTAEVLDKRTEGEDNSNNFEEKRRAVT